MFTGLKFASFLQLIRTIYLIRKLPANLMFKMVPYFKKYVELDLNPMLLFFGLLSLLLYLCKCLHVFECMPVCRGSKKHLKNLELKNAENKTIISHEILI